MRPGAHTGRGREERRDACILQLLLILKSLPGIGRRFINRNVILPLWETRGWDSPADSFSRRIAPLLTGGGTLHEIAAGCAEALAEAGRRPAGADVEAAEGAARRTMEWLDRHGDVRVLTALDPGYPAQLRDLRLDQPPLLYGRAGTGVRWESLFEGPCAAVIGSRWPGDWTCGRGPAFAEKLADGTGITIVSGLARGCDAMGHRGALRTGADTVAVIAAGPDRIVPAMHTELTEEILAAGGAILTEYEPGTEPAEFRYVERDRVTAALSDGLLVLECGVESGTMQTVKAGDALNRALACLLPPGAGAEFAGNRFCCEEYGAAALEELSELFPFIDRIRTVDRAQRSAALRAKNTSEQEEQLRFPL